MDKIDIPAIEVEDKMHWKENHNNLRDFIPQWNPAYSVPKGL